jgi:hypothetical protein
MNNIVKILFHNIKWYLRSGESVEFDERWEEEIQNMIIHGYYMGEIEIIIDGELDDYLVWSIVKD